jgi:hypothetical protein
MTSEKDRWLDRDAGPVVRPYAVTKGRTIPAGDRPFGLIDVVVATGEPPADAFRPGPEHRQLLRLCDRPVTVVDLAGDIDLPLGVVRVLLSDLSSHGMIKVTDMTGPGPVTDQRLLRNILDGLRAL